MWSPVVLQLHPSTSIGCSASLGWLGQSERHASSDDRTGWSCTRIPRVVCLCVCEWVYTVWGSNLRLLWCQAAYIVQSCVCVFVCLSRCVSVCVSVIDWLVSLATVNTFLWILRLLRLSADSVTCVAPSRIHTHTHTHTHTNQTCAGAAAQKSPSYN